MKNNDDLVKAKKFISLENFKFNSTNTDTFNHLDILFTRRDKWLSRQIRRFTRSNWSHVAIVLNYNGVIFVVDSQKNGTNIKEFSVWMDQYKYEFIRVRRWDWSTRPYKGQVIDRIHKVMGVTGYDFKSLLIKQPIYLLTGKWLGKKNEAATKRMYCSEFVAYAFNMNKFWKMHPQKLLDEMYAHPDFMFLDKPY